MNICVINGSPKGKNSITLQTVNYIAKRFKDDCFSVIDAGREIKSLEKDMSRALQMMAAADVLLFAYPVYTFLAPSQLSRFIELVFESGIDLSGKRATQITTSKHFYDVTAHRFIEDNCRDLGMEIIRGMSADMDDLLCDKGRRDAEEFWKFVRFQAGAGEDGAPSVADAKDALGDTVIVADLSKDAEALVGLIDVFRANYPYKTRLIDISKYPFKGGCLGCFNCAGDGKCVYKDGFDGFLRGEIQTAKAIVYAFAIRNHGMGSVFKTYDDRQFCNGHRTVTQGVPFGYIVLGDYENEPNLRLVIEARCSVGHNYLSGVGTDAASVIGMASRLGYAVRNGYVPERDFFGVGGMKIFRDLIWTMRGLMKADHEFYKKNGEYDFPQKHPLKMLKMAFLGSLVRNPKIRSRMGGRMTEGMLQPYKKVVDGQNRK